MRDCVQRDQLIGEWHEAILKLANQLSQLSKCSGDAAKFAKQHNATEHARLHAENARMMLELHRKDHGC